MKPDQSRNSDPDTLLMLKVKGGDMKAYEKLYQQYKKQIYNYVYSMLSHKNQAEDISQEVLLKVYRFRDKYEPQAKFRTWIWTLAKNTVIDYVRSQQNEQKNITDNIDDQFDLQDELPNAEALLIENTDQKRIQRCISELEVKSQEVLLLRIHSELSYEEISQTTRLQVSHIKTLIHRAKTQLLECFKKEDCHE